VLPGKLLSETFKRLDLLSHAHHQISIPGPMQFSRCPAALAATPRLANAIPPPTACSGAAPPRADLPRLVAFVVGSGGHGGLRSRHRAEPSSTGFKAMR
jgi:hypothetical protein